MRLLLLLVLSAAVLPAQSPEIRGSVIDATSRTGIRGVEVSLFATPSQSPRLVATPFPDSTYKFAFKPEAFGEYGVEAKMPGYTLAREGFYRSMAFLSTTAPLWQPSILMINPATITGRFVDEDKRPIAGLRVTLSSTPASGLPINVSTGIDGTFTASKVPAGAYLARASFPADIARVEDYSDEAFELTTGTYEDLVWPTGVTDPNAAVPLIVPPGSFADMGTMLVPKAELYRVRLDVQGDCSGDTWRLLIHTHDSSFETPVKCRGRTLLTGLRSGTHQIALWNDDENIRWATASLTITRSNTVLPLTLNQATDIPGRIVTPKGVPLPEFDGRNLSLVLSPDLPSLSTSDSQEPRILPDGTFLARTLRWDRYRIAVPKVPQPYYVRQIRFSGQPVDQGRIDIQLKALLEIELDNQPASISGTVAQAGPSAILLAKLPYDANAPFTYHAFAPNGRFTLTGIAPGEYRIAAATDPAKLPQLLLTAQKLTLDRAQHLTLDLKLK